ncbi:MAG: RNA methyltransferase [Acidobacteriota bacterium]|nr:RNA methyltransferase [Acidobacteriota bacterium]
MTIVSRENQRLKDIRRLKTCKEEDRALLEGPHLIAEAATEGVQLDFVLGTPDFLASEAGRKLSASLSEAPIPVEARLLEEVADADSPRGVVAAARLPKTDLDCLPTRLIGPLVFAEGLQNPGNLGALARSAEAAGACGLALESGRHGSARPYHPRALRGSAGSLLRLSVATDVSIEQLRDRYADQRPRAVALVPAGGEDLYAVDLAGALILVVGAEGAGLSPGTEEACDDRVTIPLGGSVESLNTAVAAAVVLFEVRRRNQA